MKFTRHQRLLIITQGQNQFPRSEATELAADCNELQDQLAEAVRLVATLKRNINDMRDENKLHGHITDSSAEWKIVNEPKVDAFLTKHEGLSR